MIKAVCFDFDGVIINSYEVQKKALIGSYNLVVGKNSPPPIEEFFNYSGDSLSNIFKKMGLPLKMVEPYKKISTDMIDMIKVHNGIRELLEQLREMNIKCGLCTGKDRKRTIEILNKTELLYYFDNIVCSDDVQHPKPNPESLLRVMKQLRVNSKNIVMIGDAVNDIICSKLANVPCIAVTWGDVYANKLLEYNPDYIVNDVKSLYNCITSILKLNKSFS